MTTKSDYILRPNQTPVSTPVNLMDGFCKTHDVIQSNFKTLQKPGYLKRPVILM